MTLTTLGFKTVTRKENLALILDSESECRAFHVDVLFVSFLFILLSILFIDQLKLNLFPEAQHCPYLYFEIFPFLN